MHPVIVALPEPVEPKTTSVFSEVPILAVGKIYARRRSQHDAIRRAIKPQGILVAIT